LKRKARTAAEHYIVLIILVDGPQRVVSFSTIIKRETHYNINANKNNSSGWKKITQKNQIKKIEELQCSLK
jgi:hypothetical protein